MRSQTGRIFICLIALPKSEIYIFFFISLQSIAEFLTWFLYVQTISCFDFSKSAFHLLSDRTHIKQKVLPTNNRNRGIRTISDRMFLNCERCGVTYKRTVYLVEMADLNLTFCEHLKNRTSKYLLYRSYYQKKKQKSIEERKFVLKKSAVSKMC